MKVRLFLLIAIMSAAVASCSGSGHSALNKGFSKAERLVSSKPDSSLAILRRMDVSRSDRHDSSRHGQNITPMCLTYLKNSSLTGLSISLNGIAGNAVPFHTISGLWCRMNPAHTARRRWLMT